MEFQKEHEEYIEPGTVPMKVNKSFLKHNLKDVKHPNKEHIKFFILI